MSTQQFSLRWNNYTTYITGAFESLRYEEDLVDVTLCCEGKKIRAHKILLSACSAYFKEIFKENPCQHPVIIFKNVKYTDLLAIVEFMYQGEVSVIQESLPSFLHTAELLSIRGLTDNSTDTRPQQQQQHAQPTQLQQHIIQTQDQNLLQKSITTAESVYLTLPSNSTIVHQPAKLIQTSQPQIINKTIIKPVEILQQVSTATGQSIVTPVTTQTLTAKIQTTQTDYSDLNQQLKRKKIKLHHGSDGDIYETTETTYTVAKAESDDNQMTGEDEQTVEEEYQEATSMKMEIQEYIDASQINDQLNSSNAGSTTYIQADESYELVAEGISVEKDPGTEDDGTMHDSSAEIEQSEMDMNRLLQGTSEEQKTNILQDIVSTNKWSQCQICKLVITSVNLWRHMRTQHTNQEPKRCDRCNKQFKNKYSLREHVRMAHENKQQIQTLPGSTTPPTGGGAVTGTSSSTMPSTEQTNIESDHFEALVEKKSLKLY